MKQQRIAYFDLLNICACFCVICLHCNNVVHYLYSNLRVWYQALAIETICYWAVPIFFMLSGATLLNYRERYSTKTFFKKRFFKTMIPWLFWSVVIFSVDYMQGVYLNNDITIKKFISMLLTNKIETTYWFFPVLFAVYTAIPVLAALVETKDSKKVFWYMFFMGFFTYSVCPLLFKHLGISFNYALQFPILGGSYLLFVVLGYLLSTEDIKPKHRYMLYGMAIFSMLFRYIGTVILSAQNGMIDKTFFDYPQWHSVILAAAVFVFFKYLPLSFDRKIGGVLSKISSCSFGIYLIHTLVIAAMKIVLPVQVTMWEWRYLGPFLIYGISLVVVLIIKQLPVVRNLVP